MKNAINNIISNDQFTVEITNFKEYTDIMEIVDVYGQGSNTPTKKGLTGWYGVLTVALTDKESGRCDDFYIQLTTSERTDNMAGYNGIDLTFDDINCDDVKEFRDAIDWDKDIEAAIIEYAEKKAAIHLPKDDDRCPAITEDK